MLNTTVLRPAAQTLRPYQEECVQAFQRSWADAASTPLAWLATGAGKTTILAELLVQTVPPELDRALVIGHTKEIVEQLYERIRNQYGPLLKPYYGPHFDPGIGIVMGEKDSSDARIVVATRQSLHKKRLERVLQSGPFNAVIIDESHHVAPDNSYHDIIKLLRESNPHLKVGGLTATPRRTDKKGLGVLFTHICYRWTILDGIKGGYLSPATRIKVKTGVDVSGVRTQEGDYDQKQLISVLDAANWIKLALEAYREFAEARQTLAFFPKVEMSKEFVRRLVEEGIPAAHIDANTPKEERTDTLRRYQQGHLRVISNMGVMTEGVDLPATGAILMARPTRSETLFTQIIGRGLRLYPGKVDCKIIDLTVVDTKLLDVGTVLGQMTDCPKCKAQFWKGLKYCPQCGELVEAGVSNTKPCPQCGEEIPRNARECSYCGYIIPRLPEMPNFKGIGEGLHGEIASLFHNLSSAWQPDESGWFSCGVGFDGSALVIAPPTYATNTERLKERIQRGYALLPDIDPDLRDELLSQIDMLQRELSRAENYFLCYVPPVLKDPLTNRDLPAFAQRPIHYLRSNRDLASLMEEADGEAKSRGGVAASREANWRTELASEGQRKYLRGLGQRNLSDDLSKGEAASLITHRLALRRVRAWLQEDCLPEPEEN